MSLLELPIELIFQVVDGLDTPNEVLELALTCKALYNTLGEETVLKKDAEHQRLTANGYVCLRDTHYKKCGFRVDLGPYAEPKEPILYWAITKNASVDFIERAADVLQKSFPKSLHGGWHPFYPSPLVAAVTAKRLDAVHLLLSKGCNPRGVTRRCNNTDKTFLEDAVLVACAAKDEAIAALLLDAGAETNLPEGLLEAVKSDMPDVVKRILAKFYTDSSSAQYEDDIAHAYHWATLFGANKEVIDALLSKEPRLRGEEQIYGGMCTALKHGKYHTAICLWDIFARHYMRPGIKVGELVQLAVRNDQCLQITRQICEEFPWARLNARHGYDKDEDELDNMLYDASCLDDEALLLWAIRGSLTIDRNRGTIRYLLDASCKLSVSQLEAAVYRDNIEVIDVIIAREPGFLECSTETCSAKVYNASHSQCTCLLDEQLDWTVVDKALFCGNWASAFRLISLGARCDCISSKVRVRLQGYSLEAFVAHRRSSDPDILRGVLDFIAEMRSTRPQPDKMVFATVAKSGTKEFMVQLWTLFQLTLGANFVDEYSRDDASAGCCNDAECDFESED